MVEAVDNQVREHVNKPHPIQLTRMVEDDETYWMAEILDLPGCLSDGATPEEAVQMIMDAKETWIEATLEGGYTIPEPHAEPEYSGKLLIRMPKSLHGQLASEAKREGVSLNQHIVAVLAGHHGSKR